MSLAIHPTTDKRLADSSAHAVIISAASGSGKYAVAVRQAERALGLDEGCFEGYPYQAVVRSDAGKVIGIEAIRELEHFMSLKVPRNEPINRVVIIEDAHLLTTEAQNALLKTLEEPPTDMMLILTTAQPELLLPTIRSRAQLIPLQAPDKAQLLTHFAHTGHALADIEKAYAVSGGLPGLIHALLEDTEHPLVQATEQARELLTKSAFERLTMVDQLSKDRTLALNTLFILQQMAHVRLQTASGQAAKRWQHILEASYTATEAL